MERTVTIVEKDPITNRLCFHHDRLENLIRENYAENLPVMPISIAGPQDTGKTFFMNFVVKLLNGTNTDDWIEAESESVSLNLDAMTIGSSSQNETCCIKLYHKIFRLKDRNNEDVGVMLIDCQGFHGQNLTLYDSVKIFTLSSFVSSLQIYNLDKRIRADDLHFLDFVCSCGVLISQDRPFSDLGLLIRDFNVVNNQEFNGETEGRSYLDSWLRQPGNTDFDSLQNLLDRCYEKVNCFLISSPGSSVSNGRINDVPITQISESFREHVQKYVENICRGLKAKQVNGRGINCSQLLQRFQDKFEEVNNQNLFNLEYCRHSVSHTYYDENASKLYQIFSNQINIVSNNELVLQENISYYEAIQQEILKNFDDLKDLSCPEIRLKYRQMLVDNMKTKTYKIRKVVLAIKKVNRSKRTFSNYLQHFPTFAIVLVALVVLIFSNSSIYTNNSVPQAKLEVSEVEIESYLITTVNECFSFYKDELNSKKYLIKSFDHLHEVTVKAMENAVTRFNNEVSTFKIDINVNKMELSVKKLVNNFIIKYKSKLKEKLDSFYVTLKNKFTKELELSKEEKDYITEFYEIKGNEVLRMYETQITDFIQTKPSTNELLSFARKLKTNLIKGLKDLVVVAKSNLSFTFKFLKSNEKQIKEEEIIKLSQKINEKYLGEYKQDESFALKTGETKPSKIIQVGYFSKIIKGLNFLSYSVYWTLSFIICGICIFRFKYQRFKLCLESLLFSLAAYIIVYIIQVYVNFYVVEVVRALILFLLLGYFESNKKLNKLIDDFYGLLFLSLFFLVFTYSLRLLFC